jgi:hypothetical protein
MNARAEGSRMVFVGGLHRSGTTPLARALAQHPEISGLTGTGVREDEGQHLQHVYPKAKVYGGSGRFAFDPRAHLTEDSPLATAESAERLRQAWDPHWDLGRRYLLEKSPPNLVMGRFLQAVFPGSSLVVVTRHPVVVALSNKKWRRLVSADPRRFQSVQSLVRHWVVAHQHFADDLPHLQRVHVVRYEDLVAQPERELAAVGEFLGLSSPVPADGLTAGASARYEEQWRTWGDWWRPQHAVRRAVESRLADEVARFGYDVHDLTGRAGTPEPLGARRGGAA